MYRYHGFDDVGNRNFNLLFQEFYKKAQQLSSRDKKIEHYFEWCNTGVGNLLRPQAIWSPAFPKKDGTQNYKKERSKKNEVNSFLCFYCAFTYAGAWRQTAQKGHMGP